MKVIQLFILFFLFTSCNQSDRTRKILPNFKDYFLHVQDDDPSKWDFTTDTVKIWMDDTTGVPRLNIKDKSSGGPWKEWDEVMHSITTYDSIWYNDSLHAVQGFFYEKNDFYTLIGKPATKTLRTYWLNEHDLIHQLLIYWIPEKNTTTSEHLGPIVEWAMRADSTEIRALYPGGRIVPSKENAERWKRLLQKYQESR